ncbi:MAG: CooT family nickel-binding protein [Deltaproteobacteria bacterium]|nr:CooT family nickel-binding protein [Deltaproteobacteria bacterium]
MCQMSVVLERDGRQEKIMDSVTGLAVTTEGVTLSTFFEEPRVVPDVAVARIDFLGNTLVLVPASIPAGTRKEQGDE